MATRPTKKVLKEYLFVCKLSVRKMAEFFEVTPYAVHSWLRYYGLMKDVLEELLFIQEFSVRQMAEFFAVTERTVYHWLRLYGLPNPDPIKMPLELEQRIIIEYLRLQGIEEIARCLHIAANSVRSVLSNAGIDKSQNLGAHLVRTRINSWRPISGVLAEVLDGELLGDGFIQCSWNKNVPLSHFPTDSEYLNAIDNLLLFSQMNEFADLHTIVREFNESRRIIMKPQTSSFGLDTSIREKKWLHYIASLFWRNGYACTVKPRTRKLKNGTLYKGVVLSTYNTLQLERERQRWYYPNGKKRVPHDLVLTPLMVLHWYIGDGGCSGYNFTFYTLDFPKADVQFLSDLLWRETGLGFLVRCPNKKRPEQYVLQLSTLDADHFFAYLDLAPQTILSLAKRLFPWKFDPLLLREACI